MALSHPGFYSVVAERDGTIVGSNFLDERSQIAGVGPITVDVAVQNDGIGRLLMQHVLDRAQSRGFAGVRLLQAAYHTRSLSLYSNLGFQVRDVIACMQGPAIGVAVPGYDVRAATETDFEACNQLCLAVHGHDRLASYAMRSLRVAPSSWSTEAGSLATAPRLRSSATPWAKRMKTSAP
jgi:GNAT superfamily N-acetyltransferase